MMYGPLRALARETMKEIFDEDIVRPELEFDEPSQNLVEHVILATLQQAQALQREAKMCEFCQQPEGEPPSFLDVCSDCWTKANEGSGWMQRALEAEANRKADAQIVQALEASNAELLDALECLYALVQGEVPSLLEDDHHWNIVTDAIDHAKAALLRRSPAPVTPSLCGHCVSEKGTDASVECGLPLGYAEDHDYSGRENA